MPWSSSGASFALQGHQRLFDGTSPEPEEPLQVRSGDGFEGRARHVAGAGAVMGQCCPSRRGGAGVTRGSAPSTIAILAAAAAALVPSTGRAVLGIAGAPGAGKSTLAELLVSELARTHEPDWVAHVPMDGFHLSPTSSSHASTRWDGKALPIRSTTWVTPILWNGSAPKPPQTSMPRVLIALSTNHSQPPLSSHRSPDSSSPKATTSCSTPVPGRGRARR